MTELFTNIPLQDMTESVPEILFFPSNINNKKFRDKTKEDIRRNHWEYIASKDQSGEH